MTIVAPRDGTIVYVQNWRGEKKKVGDTCWKRERAIEIPNLNKMMAKGEVDEVDAGRVAVGQRVSFRLDAHPDEIFRGTITSAAQTVQQKQGSNDPLKVMHVDIALDRTDPAEMRPGMRFKGTVELSRTRDVLLIPRSAVVATDDGPIVHRRGFFSVAPVAVKLGRASDESVQVVDGLTANDRILVSKGETSDEAKP
jgi:HlyD family secretion protein